MIKIAVPGAHGRMGSVICELINSEHDLELITNNLDSDVLIDFTSPEGTMTHLEQCLINNSAIVIGTTGLNDQQNKAIQQAPTKIPVLYSANMSIGVNACYKLLALAAKLLDQSWSVSIHDVHHQHKKDSPSGTAKHMAQVIATNSARDLNSVEILSERRGEVVGVHVANFVTPFEQIMISHVAQDRSIYAHGAVMAARWLYQKQPGIYSMQDII